MERNLSLLFILLSNLFPLYGLYYLGWSPLNAVLVFSLETICMFLFFETSMIYRIKKGESFAILPLIFVWPTLIFTVFHVFLAVSLFGLKENMGQSTNMLITAYNAISIIWLNIIFIGAQYVYNFIYSVKNKTFSAPLSKRNTGGMDRIILRIFLMQITLIVGGIVAAISGSKTFGAITLVGLQTFTSLYGYLKK